MTNTNGLTASDGNEDFQAALAAHRKGNLSAAAKVYAKVLEHDPAHAGANNNMGALLRDLGDEEEAVIYFTRALEVRPDLLETRYSLGVILLNLGDYNGARMHFRTVAKSAPSDSRALVGLAALDLRSGDSVSALKEAKEACRRNAMDANAWSIIGVANKELGRFTEAHLAYNRALDLDPNHAEAHYNRGALRLLVGDMPNGWEDYAWRWKGEGRQAPGADLGLPMWDGLKPTGDILAVIAEQGFGDTIQCLRYLPALKELGFQICLRCRPELRRLIAEQPEVDHVWCGNEPAPRADIFLPMMELPRIFSTSEMRMLGRERYLGAEPVEDIKSETKKIGLVWAGSPEHESDDRRSVPLQLLKPLVEVSRCRFVSLQVGTKALEINAKGLAGKIEDMGSRLVDFADTASVLASLDLLISVDTAVVHLAGALGQPVWVLLPFVPDWRWQLERRDSVWYSSVRLYRQPSPGDWLSVIEAAMRDLLKYEQ